MTNMTTPLQNLASEPGRTLLHESTFTWVLSTNTQENTTEEPKRQSEDLCYRDGLEVAYVQMAVEYVIALLILVFNSITIVVLIKSRALQKGTSIFLINLCIADLCIGPSIVICSIYDYFGHDMGESYIANCVICILLQGAAVTGSCFGLLLCAIERFVSVMFPLRYDIIMKPKTARILVTIQWIYNVTLNIIPLNFISWKQGMLCLGYIDAPVEVYELTYGIHIAISMVTTVGLYLKIFWEAWKQKQKIESQGNNTQTNKRNFQITKMMALILGIYILCYIPILLLSQLLLWTPETLPQWTCTFGRIALILLFANSFMNPLIYFWKSSLFRQSLKKLLGCKTENDKTCEPNVRESSRQTSQV